ncbi:MAG: acetylxylan esterase, partial [Planctomycetes bacterium]|nr:acetylxylan esterase [Planctomycetota bacterium]
MNLKIASLALVASALCCAECLALDTDVFSASQPLADARLEAAVTLDSYHPWEPCRDLASWETRAAQVRRQILVAAGLWPMPPRTPLEPVIHGRIDRGEYTIEKVFFQSLPGLYVTGSLYRPSADGGPKRPAVLSPHGHWASGRFYRRGEGEAKQQIEAGKE